MLKTCKLGENGCTLKDPRGGLVDLTPLGDFVDNLKPNPNLP